VLGVGSSGPVGAGAGPAADVAGPDPRFGAIDPVMTGAASRRAVPVAAERDAWAVIAGVRGLGPIGFAALLRRYGSGLAILDEAASPGGIDRISAISYEEGPVDEPQGRGLTAGIAVGIAEAALGAGKTLARIREVGLKVVTLDDPAYPLRLAAIDMPPHVLYVMGDPAAMDARAAVAIVGTRRATEHGRAIAARLAANLVGVGASVISGLAVGIDGAAHAAAVHARGTTVAVIGSGHAVLYPRAHSRLAAAIVAVGGAVVSELSPDTEPSHGTYPRRNRIISGLADATVVVEAPARSGALITASWALDQGRECFLVPGSIDAQSSAGCLAFLREFPDRARIVAGIPQLIDDLGLADHLAQPGVSTDVAATLSGVGEAAGRLGRELVLGRATVDELVAVTGWPVASVLAALTLLERRGLAVGIHGRFRPAGSLAGADPASARQRPRTVG
jgi:DNA processing protein